MMHEKIGPQHLGRKAILYVRQSSLHQVLHNQESRTLQYAMRERLAGLGWSEIETIDDDLGRSAAGSVVRAGFDRMVAKTVPLGFLSEPEDHADAYVLLASRSASRFMTAVILPSDGGLEVRGGGRRKRG